MLAHGFVVWILSSIEILVIRHEVREERRYLGRMLNRIQSRQEMRQALRTSIVSGRRSVV
jgi:hypothetical protein